MKTVDYKFHELCDEIDYWKSEAEYWKIQYEEMKKENIKRSNESLESAKKGVANALMFALSVEDQPDGSLKINKENRKNIADKYVK
jgi:hypothetical protein